VPYALVFIGLLLVMVAYKNTASQLGAQLAQDFTGKDSFVVWIAAIFIIGAVGYIKVAQNVSRALLVLIILVLILSNQGFFERFVTALRTTEGAPAVTPPSMWDGWFNLPGLVTPPTVPGTTGPNAPGMNGTIGIPNQNLLSILP